MKNVKLICLITSFVLVSSLVTGCGSTTKTGDSKGGTSAKVALTYSIWDKNQLPSMQTLSANFTKTHPNITIKCEVTPWAQYWTKLDASANSGGGADIFWMNGPNFQKYASNGIMLPLDDKIKTDNVDMNNYPKSLVDLYTYQGKKYAIPKDFDTVALWYNKKIFDAAKVKYPDASWNWTTLSETAKKLTDPSKGIWGIAAPLANQTGYYDTIVQAGGFIISPDGKSSGYDKPKGIAGMKFWIDLLKAKLSPTIQQMTDTTPENLFESGKIAMIYEGSWMAVEFSKNDYTKDKVDVAVLPKGVKNGTVIHGLGYAINAKTKNPKEAWEFVNYLGGKESADVQASTGTVIPAYNGTQDAWVKSMPNFNLKAYIDMLQYAVPYPVSKATSKWNDVETKYFKQAWAGTMSIEDACKKVADEMNADLKVEN